MEYLKGPELDPDQIMLSPDQLPEESVVPPASDVPMTSLFIPYQPNPGKLTYKLGTSKQPLTPWQEFLSQRSTPASKQAASPTSKVSTPKHYWDSAGRSVPVTPTQSAPHTPSTSVLNTNYRHTIELPFRSTPVPAIAELPEN